MQTNFQTRDGVPHSENFFIDGRFVATWLGDEIISRYHFISMADNPTELYVYEHGVYSRENADNTIRRYCTDVLDDRVSEARINAVTYYIQTRSLTPRNQLNTDKTRINLLNGLFNLITWELEPHRPNFLSTIQIPVNYDRNAECPAIGKFLFEILPPEDIALVLQLIGYLMIPNRDIQKAFMLTGEGGNGKGTLTRLIRKFIGFENCVSISLQKLNVDKFAVANLYGKLANICPDIPDDLIEDDTVFKAIVGKDTLNGERKYETAFDYDPFSRLIFSANDLPRHKKSGYSWERRWIIINFLRKFKGIEDDKELDDKLQTNTELSGLLNLVLVCLAWLLETKEYYYAKSPEEVGEEYKLKSEPFLVFLKECIVASDERITTASLYDVYVKWMQFNNLPKILPNNTFGGRFFRAGFEKDRPFENGAYLPHGFKDISFNLEVMEILGYKTICADGGKFNRVQIRTRIEPGEIATNLDLDRQSRYGVTGFRRVQPSKKNYLKIPTPYIYSYLCDIVTQSRNGHCLTGNMKDFVITNPVNPVNPVNHVNISTKSEQENIQKIVSTTTTQEVTAVDIQENSEKVSATYTTDTLKQLTKLIIDTSNIFGQSHGVINSSNIVAFSMWMVETYRPQYQIDGKSGYYNPSAIKKMAEKILKITPKNKEE